MVYISILYAHFGSYIMQEVFKFKWILNEPRSNQALGAPNSEKLPINDINMRMLPVSIDIKYLNKS